MESGRAHSNRSNAKAMIRITRNSLHGTADSGKLNAVKILLSRGVHINSIDAIGRTVLHVAASNGNYKMVKYLLKKKASIDCQDFEGQTPLHLAALKGHIKVVKYLIKYGAWVHAKKNDGDTALHIASAAGHPKIVKMLLKNGADVNQIVEEIMNPLYCAILGKWYLSKKRSKGAFVPYAEARLMTKVEIENQLAIIDLLLKGGVQINGTEGYVTPLHVSIGRNIFSAFKRLLERGANIEALDDRKYTPLHYAASKNSPNFVSLLLKAGANIHATDCFNWTPLHIAICYQQNNVASILIQAGSNLNALTKDEWPAFAHFNIMEKRPKPHLLHIFLENGVDMNFPFTSMRCTALHTFFSHYYDIETYACLLDYFLDWNAFDVHNKTPLVWAYERSQFGPNDTDKIIIKMMVKMENVDHFQISDYNMNLINHVYLDLYKQSKEELEILKNKKVWGNTTFYDLLVQPLRRLTEKSRNLELIDIIESGVCAEFPAYGGFIEGKMRLAQARNVLFEKSLIRMNTLISPIALPRFVGLAILNFLNSCELQNLSSA